MRIEVIVKCHAIDDSCNQLRVIVCQLAQQKYPDGFNPLTDTEINNILNEICQNAFDEGRKYERSVSNK